MRHFLTNFRYLKLIDLDNDYLELIPGLRITNSDEIWASIITDTVALGIGYIELQYMYSGDAFVYFDYEDEEPNFRGMPQLKQLETLLLWIDDILKNSWVFQDNCIMCDTAFLIDEKIETGHASSLKLQYTHTLANGLMQPVTFTKKDLKDFIVIHDKLENYFLSKESTSFRFMLEKNFSRIGRALKFIKQAREARNLPYKITNYCTALETLFTTDNMELSHKLSERVAVFLKSKFNKLNTYKTIKKAYSIRSKLTHGASFEKKDLNSIPEISFEVDNIARAAIREIIDCEELLGLFDSSNQRIDQYFENLIFN